MSRSVSPKLVRWCQSGAAEVRPYSPPWRVTRGAGDKATRTGRSGPARTTVAGSSRTTNPGRASLQRPPTPRVQSWFECPAGYWQEFRWGEAAGTLAQNAE